MKKCICDPTKYVCSSRFILVPWLRCVWKLVAIKTECLTAVCHKRTSYVWGRRFDRKCRAAGGFFFWIGNESLCEQPEENGRCCRCYSLPSPWHLSVPSSSDRLPDLQPCKLSCSLLLLLAWFSPWSTMVASASSVELADAALLAFALWRAKNSAALDSSSKSIFNSSCTLWLGEWNWPLGSGKWCWAIFSFQQSKSSLPNTFCFNCCIFS